MLAKLFEGPLAANFNIAPTTFQHVVRVDAMQPTLRNLWCDNILGNVMN